MVAMDGHCLLRLQLDYDVAGVLESRMMKL
jgi:hypothetical protein